MTAKTITRETLHGVTAESQPGMRPDWLACIRCRAQVERVEWTNGTADYRGSAGFVDRKPLGAGDLHVCPVKTIEEFVEDPQGFLTTALAPIEDETLKAAVEAAIRRAFEDDDALSVQMSGG